MKPKSDNLFHFTKSLEILKSILDNGIYPRFCLEDIEWLGLDDDKYLAFPITCFCDIPLSRISDHTDFYGNYGIGLSKNWGTKNKLNPVAYSPSDGNIQQLMKYLFHLYLPENRKKQQQDINSHAYRLLSLLKPTNGKMVISGGIIEKDFYQENEWRYVPAIDGVIQEKDFEDTKEDANKSIEKYKLEFSPSDVKYIFVKNDGDIPSLVDHINESLGMYPLNDLKILQSRIVSLDTLKQDL